MDASLWLRTQLDDWAPSVHPCGQCLSSLKLCPLFQVVPGGWRESRGILCDTDYLGLHFIRPGYDSHSPFFKFFFIDEITR